MPLYACNSSAGTQRRRCTSATGPLGHSDAVVRLQQLRWDAATRCTSATGPLGRSGVIVRVQRLSLLNLRLHAVISFIQIIHLEAHG